jgi:hypothetical protein
VVQREGIRGNVASDEYITPTLGKAVNEYDRAATAMRERGGGLSATARLRLQLA